MGHRTSNFDEDFSLPSSSSPKLMYTTSEGCTIRTRRQAGNGMPQSHIPGSWQLHPFSRQITVSRNKRYRSLQSALLGNSNPPFLSILSGARMPQSLQAPRWPPWKKPSSTPPAVCFRSRCTENSAVAGTRSLAQVKSNRAELLASGSCLQEYTAVPQEKGGVVCVEITKGRQTVYKGSDQGQGTGFHAEAEEETQQQKIQRVLRGYLLPQGYPESVAPQYKSYMSWRGVQYFFGGAMSVFTTRSLLASLGVAGKRSGEAAAAINWVLKDGAGRLGRFLFARWGRALDCELKQFRLLGDFLMEGGAALELSTILVPELFLPLACTANLSKNLAAVAASSTRAPIYRTFALQNNLADVTAKGESVANLADILGTIMGICLSRAQLPMVPTFCVLSGGYIFASRKEVDAVELPYFNRARLALASRRFLQSGEVPTVADANHSEPLLPWGRDTAQRMVLGASIGEAFDGPDEFAKAVDAFQDKAYILTYRPSTSKVYAILRQGAKPTDCLEAAFHSHFFLHLLSSHSETKDVPLSSHLPPGKRTNGMPRPFRRAQKVQQALEWSDIMSESRNLLSGVFDEFRAQSLALGWKLPATMLNPRETRLVFG